jgi:hypothetical protein
MSSSVASPSLREDEDRNTGRCNKQNRELLKERHVEKLTIEAKAKWHKDHDRHGKGTSFCDGVPISELLYNVPAVCS